MAKITKVYYRAIVDSSDSQKEACELEATLQEGDNWEEVFEDLREKVSTKLHSTEENYRIYEQYCEYNRQASEAKRQLRALKKALETAKSVWEKAVDFLKTQGLDPKNIKGFPPYVLSLIDESVSSELDEDEDDDDEEKDY